MQVHTDIEHLPSFTRAIVTIGTFDGVHLGHQKIIEQLKAEAVRTAGETVIITFHPHPRKVVHDSSRAVKLLTTIEERIELLSARGIDHLVIVPFTKEFSELLPREYAEKFLIGRFHPDCVIIGYDHRFGRQRAGSYRLLEEYHANGFFDLKEIPGHLINDSTVSSTLIRNALNLGNIAEANNLLGYPFFFGGLVVPGDQRGRTIGFPTANLKLSEPEKIIPANGVYVVELELTDAGVAASPRKKGMMNIGSRPTVNGSGVTIEVNIFDFDEDIYGRSVRVFVHDFLRPEQKFETIQALRTQLENDRNRSMHHFNH